jgi:hypothetical protein
MFVRAKKSGGILAVIGILTSLLMGCGKNDSPSGTGGNPPGSVITVTGRVFDLNSQPVASVPVIVSGKTSTNSDASGNFTVTGVTVPYDVTVVVPTGTKGGLVYKGLTRSDPTLFYPGTSPAPLRSATVNGTVSGGAFTPTQPADHKTIVFFGSADAALSTTTTASGTFSLGGTWFGPTSTSGALYALQYQVDGSGIPVADAYKGYGVKSGLVINDASVTNNQLDTLKTLPTRQLTGTLTPATGYTLSSRRLFARFSSTAVAQLLTETTNSPSLSYYTPEITGGSLIVSATGNKAGVAVVTYKVGVAANASGVTVNIPAGPELSLPVAGATGVDTTVTFSWTPFSGGVHLIFFTSTGNPSFYVLTTGTSTTIPNLKSYGVTLPAATTYNWMVLAVAPVGSSDAAASSVNFLSFITGPQSITSDVSFALAGARTFVTAP